MGGGNRKPVAEASRRFELGNSRVNVLRIEPKSLFTCHSRERLASNPRGFERNSNEFYGGGGSRTLVPWQVDANIYVRRSQFISSPPTQMTLLRE